jgi:hypothetical protein
MFSPRLHLGFSTIVLSTVLLACGTSRVWIVTKPPGALAFVDGKPLENGTPTFVQIRRSFLARGSNHILITADGYQPIETEVEHAWDSDCVKMDLFEGAILGPLLLGPAVKLLRVPWCSRPETDELSFELVPVSSSVQPVSSGP